MTATPTGDFLVLDDGRPAVRLTRVYDHPIERVWQFVTDPEELVHWFPSRAEIELSPGGTVRYSGDPSLADTTGKVLEIEAPQRLSFTWGPEEVHFELTALDERRTRFTLTNVLSAVDAAARNGAGWEVCLGALDARSADRAYDGPHAGPTPAWEQYYRAYRDAGIPSGAEIPGVDPETL
ncbi:SRPBCC family protein [Nocardia sp. NBC_00511]|uniref:SRPBCC family protein n=1 Tax=Nocardia sp. NBC_00511 TaxID=2903591 RepID=UPI0030E01848